MNLRSMVAAGARRAASPLRAWVPPEQWADLRHRLGTYLPWEGGFDLSPPPLGPGETAGPPDFVGVGGQRGGAAWWFRLVTDHPGVTVRDDIAMGSHFLSHYCTAPFGDEEVERYHGWFPRRAGTITGEWTPSYLAQPWVAPLLAQAAPAVRLLVMVRDPVERLRLALASTVRHRGDDVGPQMAEAVDRGFTARPLRRLLEYVPAEQVLTLQYERCVADPTAQLAATYRFLGLDDAHRPEPMLAPNRAAVGPGELLDPDTKSRLVDLYSSDVAELVALVPDLDLSLWPAFVDAEPGPGDR